MTGILKDVHILSFAISVTFPTALISPYYVIITVKWLEGSYIVDCEHEQRAYSLILFNFKCFGVTVKSEGPNFLKAIIFINMTNIVLQCKVPSKTTEEEFYFYFFILDYEIF